jgi:ribose-phosphate pyrophosphokinase
MVTLHNAVNDEWSPVHVSGLTFRSMVFPGGEPHVQVDPGLIRGQPIWIDARVGSADDFLMTLALADAVRACRPSSLGLFIPYFPGARQDRRPFGTAFTVEIYAAAIRRLELEALIIFDPHSDVAPALLPGVEIISAGAVAENLITGDYAGIICPDAGAEKRVHDFARAMSITNIIHARKSRDVVTGNLSGFSVDHEQMEVGRNYLVVDDICDGGGTFVGLRKAIPTPGRFGMDLWVSHGIFSKGIGDLLESYGRIFTTDSFPFKIKTPHPQLFVAELRSYAAAIMQKRLT